MILLDEPDPARGPYVADPCFNLMKAFIQII